ncbi:Type 3 secretion system secretin [Carnimonas sp. R-84981]|uniref:type IV pilus secretin PilQ n=1 Tax=Carnimonas bestiolae TaxID=3402172 RepID=UPI003EDBFD0F
MKFVVVTLLLALIALGSAHATTLEDVSWQQRNGSLLIALTFDTAPPAIETIALGQPTRTLLRMNGTRTRLAFKREGKGALKWISVAAVPGGSQLVARLESPHIAQLEQDGKRVNILLTPIAAGLPREAEPRIQRIDAMPIARQSPDNTSANGRVSVDFQQLPVRAALLELAAAGDIDLLVEDQVAGDVTLHLEDTFWRNGLDMILRSHGLDAQQVGDALVITQRGAKANAEDDRSPLMVEVVKLGYANGSDIVEVLKGKESGALLSERGSISFDKRSNQLVLRDTEARLAQIEPLIAQLDHPLRQVQIEAKIVIAREQLARQLGIRWGAAGGSGGAAITAPRAGNTAEHSGHGPFLGIGIDLGSSNATGASTGVGFLDKNTLLGLELTALEQEGISHTLSQPRIMTLDREQASIRQGQEVPYQEAGSYGSTSTSFRDAVLALNVTPYITAQDTVVMTVDVQNDSVAADRFNGLPAINTSRITTRVMVENGETVVLGGILTKEQARNLSKIPWLGDIPGIGRLFTSAGRAQEQVELLVFITPSIIEQERAPW